MINRVYFTVNFNTLHWSYLDGSWEDGGNQCKLVGQDSELKTIEN